MTAGVTAGSADGSRLAWQTSYRVRFDEAGPDGHLRTSVFYSILLEEWPAVKAKLEAWLSISKAAKRQRNT